MSIWLATEDQVVSVLRGLSSDAGGALLATVEGRTWRDKRTLLKEITRERMPMAWVMVEGRSSSGRDVDAGEMRLLVWLADRSERQTDEARRGGVEAVGILTLCRQVSPALQHLEIDAHHRLRLLQEAMIGGEAGLAVWEQQYAVQPVSGFWTPTFEGVALAGADSEVQVEVGVLERRSSRFSFPGVDGVFERFSGTGGRPIVWRGQMRAADDWAMNALEADIEARIRGGEMGVVYDNWARRYGNCVIQAYQRKGLRRRDGLSGEALQSFEIHFLQLLDE